MRKIVLISLAMLGSGLTALPAAAQDATNGRIAWSNTELNKQKQRPFWAPQARTFGNCVVKADAANSLRFVRTAAGSTAEQQARAALAPALRKCESALGAWGPHLRDDDRREAVQAALGRNREKRS